MGAAGRESGWPTNCTLLATCRYVRAARPRVGAPRCRRASQRFPELKHHVMSDHDHSTRLHGQL
eukprot:1826477-Pleurochrysis_carterae.AAC.1